MVSVPEISKKISQLHSLLKEVGNSPEDIASKINDILLFGEKIPRQLVLSAWEFFATEMGVKQ